MSKKLDLSLGFGGPTLLMSDGDVARNIRGYALQALEDCTFSQFELDQEPAVSLERKYAIESVTSGSNSFTIKDNNLPHDLAVGDKVWFNWGGDGADLPLGTVQDSEGRPTELKDKTIYFIESLIATDTVTLEESVGAGAITITNTGTVTTNSYIAKVSDQSFSYGTFTRNASANDRTHEIGGSVDGRIFKTDDDGGNQVNMFDTTGGAVVGDVVIPKGMTIFLPVQHITLTTGACIVYTKL
tara:strand:+ start:104 stop:829 length:726 start_codon:yes stop_codon:yes gene_type:complete